LNAAIRPLLDRLNDKVSRHLGASRSLLFEQLDKPALKPLPVAPHVYAGWKKCRAGLDDHIAIDRHHYPVPDQLPKKELWARITTSTVEAFHVGQRVASHVRTFGNARHSTHPLPGRRLRHADGVLSARRNLPGGAITCPRTTGSARIGRRSASRHGPPVSGRPCWAARVGPNVAIFTEVVMRERRHPEQGYRTCLGVIRLADRFGRDRLDAACNRALESSPCGRHRSEARGGRPILLISPFDPEEWAGQQGPHPHPRHALSAACIRMRLPTAPLSCMFTCTRGG